MVRESRKGTLHEAEHVCFDIPVDFVCACEEQTERRTLYRALGQRLGKFRLSLSGGEDTGDIVSRG